MAKYIDAEKLIAEIGKLTNQKKKQLERFSDEDYCCSVASSINCELSGNLEVLSIIKSIQQEQPEAPSNLIDADAVRDDFVREIYRVLDADTTNDRANAIIDAFDSLPTIQQEQPKFKVGELIVSKYNPHLTYKILATNIPNELGKMDYKVEIFTDGQPGQLGKPHNIRLISSDKIEDWGELVKQEVDLEKELDRYLRGEFQQTAGGNFNNYIQVARHFYELGLNARKEE